MKINKKLTGLVASALCASSLSAGVSLATDGTGDFLIAPFYEAKNDVCSEIKVFNTNETNSILAKVAIREQISSQEVDLPIFLSPGDAWSGTLCEVEGKVLLRSTDDSNHPIVKDILANGKDLNAHSLNAGHKNVDFRNGYVEIYPIAQFNEKSTAKVKKDILVKRWDALINGSLNVRNLKRDGVDNDSLSGSISFRTNNKETSTQQMKAFENAHSKQRVGGSIAYAEDTSPEVLLGQQEKFDILRLLQNSTTSVMYEDFGKNQFIYFSFPFGYTEGQERSFEFVVRDMSENKDLEKTVVFSPRPRQMNYVLENELYIMPVSELISKTQDSTMYKKGMIQIKNIRNRSNHQLGIGRYASFLPTSVIIEKNGLKGTESYISSVVETPVK
ncbi:hypothetical protein [Arcobacter roscoffensis]|uniref:Uncharacterized protein n=1 Tax=Arcobacter roscoffensis TaxID=2961520 RepID=A0ABY5E676_9BACT|nr:hypothetical protein [Arcobacter roscoffensis]UTJ06628.1 hypothetical protein NJU99_00620 [Arcobacter roscoffensis]